MSPSIINTILHHKIGKYKSLDSAKNTGTAMTCMMRVTKLSLWVYSRTECRIPQPLTTLLVNECIFQIAECILKKLKIIFMNFRTMRYLA